MERERDREPGEDEIGRVVQRVTDRVGVAERAVDQDTNGRERIGTDHEHNERGEEERNRDVHDRDETDLRPARQGPAVPHGGALAAFSAAPAQIFAIIRPSVRSSASGPATSPTIRPPHMTRMRSASDITSSSSTVT